MREGAPGGAGVALRAMRGIVGGGRRWGHTVTRKVTVARTALLLFLGVLSPALADDAARIAAIRERAVLAADVLRVARLAEACGRRDAAWAGRVRTMVIARQEVDAARFGNEVEGGREAVRWLMLGARLVADAAADAEHDRYGAVACAEMDETGDVAGMDRLLAAEGR